MQSSNKTLHSLVIGEDKTCIKKKMYRAVYFNHFHHLQSILFALGGKEEIPFFFFFFSLICSAKLDLQSELSKTKIACNDLRSLHETAKPIQKKKKYQN